MSSKELTQLFAAAASTPYGKSAIPRRYSERRRAAFDMRRTALAGHLHQSFGPTTVPSNGVPEIGTSACGFPTSALDPQSWTRSGPQNVSLIITRAECDLQSPTIECRFLQDALRTRFNE